MKSSKIVSILAFAFMLTATYAESATKDFPPAQPQAEAMGKLPPEAKAKILERFDKDGDGYLNDEELAEAKKAIENRRERFVERQREFAKNIVKEYDKDGDGKLSEEELLPFLVMQYQMFAELRMLLPPEVREEMRGYGPDGKNFSGDPVVVNRNSRGSRPEGGSRMGSGDRPNPDMQQAQRPERIRDGRGAPRPDLKGEERQAPRPQDMRKGERPQQAANLRIPQAPITPDDLDELAKPKAQ